MSAPGKTRYSEVAPTEIKIANRTEKMPATRPQYACYRIDLGIHKINRKVLFRIGQGDHEKKSGRHV